MLGPMSLQPGPSGLQDLPMTPLPLTQTQHEEFDQAIRKAFGCFILDSIKDPKIADTDLDDLSSVVPKYIIEEANRIFKHNNLNNELDTRKSTKDIVEQHPQPSEN
ncbi:hypothetical protein EDB19DRAFT_1832177 [Suillus lakei]|nr:hypothetical protein EDB19DRAFT_1832177 [Suillus lakei]